MLAKCSEIDIDDTQSGEDEQPVRHVGPNLHDGGAVQVIGETGVEKVFGDIDEFNAWFGSPV